MDGITLETFLNNPRIELVDLLKIDIEGAQEAIFNSTRDATLCQVKHSTIEFHDFLPGSISSEEVKKITNRLKRLGFICIPFSYLLPHMDTCDFLFINTNRCKIPYRDSLGFPMINWLLTIEKTTAVLKKVRYAHGDLCPIVPHLYEKGYKSSLLGSAFKGEQSVAN